MLVEGLPLIGMRTRIAPTPSGFLHEGNGINFSATWQLAQAHNGHVLLRIDDLDEERTRPEYVDDIFRTLEWLGIEWHEGPATPDDFHRNWSQRSRGTDHTPLLEGLRSLGLVYACDCSRNTIAAIAPDGRYPGTCRSLGKSLDDEGNAWRLNVGRVEQVDFHEMGIGHRSVDLGTAMGDPVVLRRSTPSGGRGAAYQIASLADDLHFGINTIVRGEDLLASTACQSHIADLLGLDQFRKVAFLHHQLTTGTDGQKLSKSAGATSLKSWSESGRSAEAIHAAARTLLRARGLLPDAG